MFAELGAKFAAIFGERELGPSEPSYTEKFYSQLLNFYKIADLFPYEQYDPKSQMFFQQDSCGFVLEVPPLVGASEQMQKEASGIFQNLLPEESSLQVCLYADPHIAQYLQHWQSLRCDQFKALSAKRAAFLQQFAFNSPQFPYTLRQFRCFISCTKKAESDTEKVVKQLQELKTQIKTALEMLGLSVTVWDAQMLINTLGGIINMHPQQEPHSRRWDQLQSLNTQIADVGSCLTLDSKNLYLNSGAIKVRTYQVTQTPLVWSLHAMGQLIGDEERDIAQIGCPFILHYGIFVPKQGLPKARAFTKATYVERQASSPIGKFLPGIKREAEELAFVREQLGKGERIVQTQLNIILLATDATLTHAEQTLTNLYLSKEWQIKPNHLFHLPVFLNSLPMMWSADQVQALLHYKKLKTTLSTESANLLPLQGEWRGTSTPGLLLAGRRGQLMQWYPFDNQSGNYNVTVVGRSGSGKSVFMQEMIKTTLALNGRVFVLDVGRSFEKICYFAQGQFIEFKTKTPLCLNPFSSIALDDVEAAQDALAMLKSVLVLMTAPTQGLSDLEIALLEQAMLSAWKQQQQQCTINHIAQILLDSTDLQARRLGTMLFPYTDAGNYGRFFNGVASVNLENPLVVVELEELKERKDLQAVVVQMIIINITNKMFLGDRQTPFMIVFDEAWDLLRGAQSGVFIETLARRLRKYYGSLVVGTQSINDLFSSPAATAAFDNSDWTCLLSQKPETIAQLKKLDRLHLTESMQTQLISVKAKHGSYAEVMIVGNHGYAVGRLLLDPYSLLLYSTKPKDYSAVQTLRAQGMSLEEALETVLRNRGEQ